MILRTTALAGVATLIAVAAAVLWFVGLPLQAVPPPKAGIVGAVSDMAADLLRKELFATSGERVVPLQILYPASVPGRSVFYVPNAGPVISAIARIQGRLVGTALQRIGNITAPWTGDARPRTGGPFPVVLHLPGVTGYMQMSSFQTVPLAADGFIVVTLNQPGVVAAAVLPDGRVIEGMSRDEASQLIAPSYRDVPLPVTMASQLAPERSIVPYLAADIPAVLGRLQAINADPLHPLYSLLDLENIGVMGVSLGAIVAAQACQLDVRIKACLMLDAPVPKAVADSGLRQRALWVTRPPADQRAERAASGGWPEAEIAAQATSIARAASNSQNARVVTLHGLFHADFTDVPTIQPVAKWVGMSGPVGSAEAHQKIVSVTLRFFAELKAL